MPSSARNDGGSPWRTAWAPRTIMLPAAWRKMCVSSATGTARAATRSANGLPAPTGASWSASPTSTTCVRPPTARSSVTSSSRLAIEVSSTISSRASIASTVGPWPGIQPSAAWIVVASASVDSVIRRAARPVGATSTTLACCALAAATSSRIVAVFPVPGPPVTTESRCANAAATAAALRWRGLQVGVAHGARRLQHRLRRGELLDPLRQLRLERPGRRAVRPRPVVDLDHELAVAGHRAEQRGVRRRAVEQRRRARRRARRPGGRSSRRAPPRRARGPRRRALRAGASGAIPPARAIASAIRNPTPNTLVSSYGRSRTTRCARSPCSLVIRGTSQASPCGASWRCSARLDRSPCHERTASFVRFGLSPAARSAPCGSASIASRTSAPCRASSCRARPSPTCLTRLRYASSAASPDGASGSAVATRICIPKRRSSCQVPRIRARSRSSRCAIGPTRTSSSPSRSASSTAKPPSSPANRIRRTVTSPSNAVPGCALDHRPPEATAMGGLASGAVASPLALITAARPEDPVLDIAVTHALLRAVAAGERSPALRVFVPGPTAAFGRLDALRPGFAAAADAARAPRAHPGDPAGRRPRGGLRAGRGRGRARDRPRRTSPRGCRSGSPTSRGGCGPRSPGSAPTPGSASCRASTARAATASTSAAGSRWRGSRSGRSAAPRSPPRS